MSQVQNGSEAAAAALVGSLATFSLIDVLDLLARTGHTGELQVVGRGIDRRVWVDEGDLVDAAGAGNLGAVLFELASRDEGWFYFSCSTAVPEGAERITVSEMMGDIGPKVEEWRSLTAELPFESVVSMSSSTPAAEVQIRADQWHLISLVGSPGKTVREVMDAAGGHPVEVLRTLHELVESGLVEVGPATPAPDTAWHPPATGGVAAGTGDPEPPLPPFVPPPPPGAGTAPPPAPEGWVTAASPPEGSDGAGAASPDAAGDGAADGNHAVMPPPISGDPWSSSLSADEKEDAD